MAKRAAAKFPSVDEYLELFAAPAPPSGALINAVLEHADIRQEIGGGRVVLRLSERRANHRLVRRGHRSSARPMSSRRGRSSATRPRKPLPCGPAPSTPS